MIQTRVIPCLLLSNDRLVKTVQFNNPGYIGDPINAVKIYNELQVDELIFLDISATIEHREPPFKLIQEIAEECFMPFCYGGGIRTIAMMKKLFNLGSEKIALNTVAVENPVLIQQAARTFGSQSIVISIDVKWNRWAGSAVYTHGGKKNTKLDPLVWAKQVEKLGAGEILLTSIDHEGTWNGFDIDLISKISSAVTIPVIAHGGAGKITDIADAVRQGGAHAVGLGSMIVYQGKDLGVLINFPERNDIEKVLSHE